MNGTSIFISTVESGTEIEMPEHKQDVTSQLFELRKRTVRSRTLDGGISFQPQPFNLADSDINVTFRNLTREDFQNLRKIFKENDELVISTITGKYTIVPDSIVTNSDGLTLNCFIKEAINEY